MIFLNKSSRKFYFAFYIISFVAGICLLSVQLCIYGFIVQWRVYETLLQGNIGVLCGTLKGCYHETINFR